MARLGAGASQSLKVTRSLPAKLASATLNHGRRLAGPQDMARTLQARRASEQECAVTPATSSGAQISAAGELSARTWGDAKCKNSAQCIRSISGLVAEYIVAIDVTRVRFPADAFRSHAFDVPLGHIIFHHRDSSPGRSGEG